MVKPVSPSTVAGCRTDGCLLGTVDGDRREVAGMRRTLPRASVHLTNDEITPFCAGDFGSKSLGGVTLPTVAQPGGVAAVRMGGVVGMTTPAEDAI